MNPAVIAVLAFALLGGLPGEGSLRWIFWAIVLGPGVPATYAVTMYMRGGASSVFLPDPRQRVIPLFVASASCLIGMWQLTQLSAPLYVLVLMLAYALIAFVSALVSRSWGISLHSAGVWAPWVVGIALLDWEYVWVLPVPFVIGWARIRDRGHTLRQVVSGALLGVVSVFVSWWLTSKLGI